MRFLLDATTSPYIVYHITDDYILNNYKREPSKNSSLVNYMTKNEAFSILLDTTKCIITNEPIEHYESLSTDGYWIWSADLEHYIKKFNIKMPDHFMYYLESIKYLIKPIPRKNLETLYFKKFTTVCDEDGKIDSKTIKLIEL